MTDTELRELLTECLPDAVLKSDGQILYSGIDTLKPGSFYFVGFNPAADGTNPLLCDVPLDRKQWSAYTQQCWTHKHCDLNVCPKVGKKPHQLRVQAIMSELGLRSETTFATNLIFVESRNAKQIYDDVLFEACWRVHKKMLAEIKPKYIVCFGNGESLSAFSLVRRKADSREKEARNREFKSFVGTFCLGDRFNLTAKVIGLRHPSYPMSPRGLRDFVGL
jgi:hypothetical protein